jgi:hypothetical protein
MPSHFTNEKTDQGLNDLFKVTQLLSIRTAVLSRVPKVVLLAPILHYIASSYKVGLGLERVVASFGRYVNK